MFQIAQVRILPPTNWDLHCGELSDCCFFVPAQSLFMHGGGFCCRCAQDLVQEGVNGFTFDPYNVEQLAQLMLQISSLQPFRLSAFGDASRAIIRKSCPERFGAGLKLAAEIAVEGEAMKASRLQRMILKALLLK
jgi:hypothetical protein